MAPSNVDVSEVELYEKVKQEQKENQYYDSQARNIDAFDVMLPKNDPIFLRPIRHAEKSLGFLTPLKWMNIGGVIFLHTATVLWLLLFTLQWQTPHWKTIIYSMVVGQIAGFGVTAGVHRLWCHRTYKAKLPLQVILLFCYSLAGQNTVFEWVRDHRVHHKFSETSADPHDVRRGFFFSHVGWLMMKKHPDVVREGRKIEMTDITEDPLLKFYDKYFLEFKVLACFVLPTLIPVYFWNESWAWAVFSQMFLRYMLSLNFTWSVNSFAHIWGNKPYDKNIKAVENWGVAMMAIGEGWHNYHHTFPWDYKAAELGHLLNLTTLILDLFAKIGWAYDLKEASPELVEKVIKNKGE